MAPGVTLDLDSDFVAPIPAKQPLSTATRTLLLSPPSLSSHPEKLNAILQSHDRNSTDIQMLDRLSLGLVSLPESTYDMILILVDADGSRRESRSLLSRDMMNMIVRGLRPGGKLCSQDGGFAVEEGEEKREAILAGLVEQGGDGMVKPDYSTVQSVPLRFGRKKPDQAPLTTNDRNPTISSINGKRKIEAHSFHGPAGVGFVDGTDGVSDGEDDDELIDEDTLLDENDLSGPVIQPPECRPKAGKRRRACKDCTCGLKEKLESEDAAKRSAADKALNAMKLGADDLAEVDFTVQGKVGSCGNCALGDAFRCDGCPYIGLPPFKPGEEVRLINNDVQL